MRFTLKQKLLTFFNLNKYEEFEAIINNRKCFVNLNRSNKYPNGFIKVLEVKNEI